MRDVALAVAPRSSAGGGTARLMVTDPFPLQRGSSNWVTTPAHAPGRRLASPPTATLMSPNAVSDWSVERGHRPARGHSLEKYIPVVRGTVSV